MLLHRIRNIPLRVDENAARDPDNSLVGTAAGTRGQARPAVRRHVDTDDGEITVLKFKDVRAVLKCRGGCAIGVRVGSESAKKHSALTLTIIRCVVNSHGAYILPVPVNDRRARVCANVARLLRASRIAQNLSMTALAERAGLSQQMVSYVERGLRIPSLDTLLRLTDAMDLDLAEIVRQATND